MLAELQLQLLAQLQPAIEITGTDLTDWLWLRSENQAVDEITWSAVSSVRLSVSPLQTLVLLLLQHGLEVTRRG